MGQAMRKIALSLLVAASMGAGASECVGPLFLDARDERGAWVVTEEGQLIRIDKEARQDVAFWTEGDELSVCADGLIVNHDDKTEARAVRAVY